MWLRPDTSQLAPKFNIATSLDPDSSPWEYVPTRPLPACCVPADLGAHAGCLLKVTGPHESLITAGLKRGFNLTVFQLKALITAFSVVLPGAGTGSGKGGRFIKCDYVKAVLAHFLPEQSQEERDALIAKMVGRRNQDREDDTPETHLKLLSKLDPAEAAEFDVMRQVAVNQLAEKALRAKVHKPPKKDKDKDPDDEAEPEHPADAPVAPPGGPAAGKAAAPVQFLPRTSGTHVRAPAEFRELLPPNVDYVYFHWEPQSRRVAIEFKRSSEIKLSPLYDCLASDCPSRSPEQRT